MKLAVIFFLLPLKTKQNPVPCRLYYAYLSLTSRYNNTTATVSDFHSSVWVNSCLSEEHIFTEPLVISAFSIRCLPECGSLFCNPETVQSVNPGTLCDGGVLRAQHSPLWGRLLFIPVMSILLGISASLHTTCCAQQCGEARASRVVVSVCQSQSQGSVSSHHSEKPYPDVACLPSPHALPPHTIHFPLFAVWVFCLYRS